MTNSERRSSHDKVIGNAGVTPQLAESFESTMTQYQSLTFSLDHAYNNHTLAMLKISDWRDSIACGVFGEYNHTISELKILSITHTQSHTRRTILHTNTKLRLIYCCPKQTVLFGVTPQLAESLESAITQSQSLTFSLDHAHTITHTTRNSTY